MEAHLGALEAYYGALETHHGAMEAHHGTIEAHHGAIEAHHGAMEAHRGPWRLTIGHGGSPWAMEAHQGASSLLPGGLPWRSAETAKKIKLIQAPLYELSPALEDDQIVLKKSVLCSA